jgi:transcriptional regulator GlxA family with amidase domain
VKELLDVVTRVYEYQRPHPALVGTATLGDRSHRIAKAIAWLRTNYTKPLRVEELVEIARLGMSTLHHHFRALTAISRRCSSRLASTCSPP